MRSSGRTARIWPILFLLLVSSLPAQEEQLIDFDIQDQFKNDHRDEDFAGAVIVVLCSDKGGSKYNEAWGHALTDSLRQKSQLPNVKFLPVADLRGVPFFLKGFVRGKFPKDSTRWVLTDWKGKFAKAYELEKDACNIVIFDRSGRFYYKAAVYDMDYSLLSVILTKIRNLLAETPTNQH